MARRAGTLHKPAVLALVAVMLFTAASGRLLGSPVIMLGGLVMAMGALNNTFQRGGEVTVGLTYMTGALVRMGQGIAAKLTGKDGGGWENWLLLWLGLAIGGACGAWLTLHTTWPTVWLGAGGAAMLCLAAWRITAPHAD